MTHSPDTLLSVSTSWTALETHINKFFFEPDIEALRIVLASIACHLNPGDPVSLFIQGPPGSGKTKLHINAILGLPQTHLLGNLTPKTFVSGHKSKRGILQTVGRDAILCFKDLTTLLSKRDTDKLEILGQIREIADGFYDSRTGMSSDSWEGKITFLAACTPALERAWKIRAELGERFLRVRLLTSAGPDRLTKQLSVSSTARAQRGHEKEIKAGLQRLVKEFWGLITSDGAPPVPLIPKVPPKLSPSQETQIDSMACALAMLRTPVHRHESKISEVDEPENASRIGQGLSALAQWHAGLFRLDYVDACAMKAARRVFFDSIPLLRFVIVKDIPSNDDTNGFSESLLQEETKLPRPTFDYHLDDLQALEVIRIEERAGGLSNRVQFTDDFRRVWRAGTRV